MPGVELARRCRRVAMFAVYATLLLTTVACQRQTPAPIAAPPTAAAKAGPVTIEIVSGDDDQAVQTQTIAEVAPGTTVEQLMRQLEQPSVTITGSGTTAFVHAIGDQATGGGEGWTFTIDGQFINTGIGSATVDPPATIRWKFGGFEPAE